MFYAHFVLSKRGPLARIWLAAHWDKKLTKAHVFETDLEDSVKTIISPQVKMALRTSGHLLLGVVRIYNRKAKYLLTDCNEAFVKIKMAFRPGVVDLPEENREAQHNQIYLVEEFHNFDTPLPDITDFDINRQLTLNQSRIDEITMPEEVPTAVRLDEGFGGGMMEFGKEAEDRYSAGDLQNMFYKEDDDGRGGSKSVGFGMESSGIKEGFSAGMGDEGILGGSFMQGPGLFGEGQDGGLFGERSPRKPVEEEVNPMENAEGAMDNQIMSPAPPPPQQPLQIDEEATLKENMPEGFMNQPVVPVALPDQQAMEVDQQQPVQQQEHIEQQQQEDMANRTETVEDTTSKDQTTLVANEEEAFALEPLDVTGVRDLRMRRKRKLIVDHVMELDGQTMRDQLKDFNDIVTTLDMAPPTKRLMQWKEMGGVEKLFSLPSRSAGDDINKLFASNLHHSIPSDLLDVTGTQLHQQFGDISNEQEISAVPDVRDDNMVNDMRIDPHSHTTVDPTESVLMQDKDPSMNQANMPAAYNSDDDYEAYSVGPQSVGSSDGDRPGPPNVGGQTPHPNPLPENTMLSGLDVPATDMPSLNETGMSEFPMLPSPEGESFADDVDDLRWNKRTQHLLHSLQRSFKHEQEVSLFQMTEGITRKQAVSKFYSLLVLAKQEATHLVQSQIFGDVYIRKGPKFESILM